MIGQDLVLSASGDAVGISRAGLQAPNRPVASFLFLRPIGVEQVRPEILNLVNVCLTICLLDGIIESILVCW